MVEETNNDQKKKKKMRRATTTDLKKHFTSIAFDHCILKYIHITQTKRK